MVPSPCVIGTLVLPLDCTMGFAGALPTPPGGTRLMACRTCGAWLGAVCMKLLATCAAWLGAVCRKLFATCAAWLRPVCGAACTLLGPACAKQTQS